MRELSGREREMLALGLQGCDVPEISARVGRSERTVQRVLKRVREQPRTDAIRAGGALIGEKYHAPGRQHSARAIPGGRGPHRGGRRSLRGGVAGRQAGPPSTTTCRPTARSAPPSCWNWFTWIWSTGSRPAKRFASSRTWSAIPNWPRPRRGAGPAGGRVEAAAPLRPVDRGRGVHPPLPRLPRRPAGVGHHLAPAGRCLRSSRPHPNRPPGRPRARATASSGCTLAAAWAKSSRPTTRTCTARWR